MDRIVKNKRGLGLATSQASGCKTSPFVLLNLECGKEVKKLQKLEFLESGKSFYEEIKSIFCSFWRVFICEGTQTLSVGSLQTDFLCALIFLHFFFF